MAVTSVGFFLRYLLAGISRRPPCVHELGMVLRSRHGPVEQRNSPRAAILANKAVLSWESLQRRRHAISSSATDYSQARPDKGFPSGHLSTASNPHF
jgi:hypothetical protein